MAWWLPLSRPPQYASVRALSGRGLTRTAGSCLRVEREDITRLTPNVTSWPGAAGSRPSVRATTGVLSPARRTCSTAPAPELSQDRRQHGRARVDVRAQRAEDPAGDGEALTS